MEHLTPYQLALLATAVIGAAVLLVGAIKGLRNLARKVRAVMTMSNTEIRAELERDNTFVQHLP